MMSINEFESSPSDLTKVAPIDLTLTDEELEERFRFMQTPQLMARKMIAEQVSKEAHNKYDPRWERVSDQGRLIDLEIVRRAKKIREKAGLPEPLAQIVEMQPARTKVHRHALLNVSGIPGIPSEHIELNFEVECSDLLPPEFSAADLGLLKVSINKEKDNG